jgi:hypothetical protein
MIEHRRYLRHLPPVNTFAALGKKYAKVGKVKNISLGGLSFEYICGNDTAQNLSQIDLFVVGNVFHLYNVPCRTIYDIQIYVPHVQNHFTKILTTKRCGIEFDNLSYDFFVQLKLFLQLCTCEFLS